MHRPSEGGPAFPVPDGIDPNSYAAGMSLRDYFAARAMTAILTAQEDDGETVFSHRIEETVARLAYDQADAMLAAREE